jgi:UDP-glucose 4-epimerase
LRSVSLRYFNAAGADPSGLLGERHVPETHLIPLVLQVASGRRPHIEVFGQDYPTEDGTCVRDYIHVVDLCRAHLLAMQYLLAGGASTAYNLGNGAGFSVRRVIDAAKRITGRPIQIVHAPRRPGDAAVLVADCTRAKAELRWEAQYPDIETILAHAWQWESRHSASPMRPEARSARLPGQGESSLRK